MDKRMIDKCLQHLIILVEISQTLRCFKFDFIWEVFIGNLWITHPDVEHDEDSADDANAASDAVSELHRE